MQKRGQASPDDGDALALTFAQEKAPVKVEERDEDYEIFGRYGIIGPGAWMHERHPASREFAITGRRPHGGLREVAIASNAIANALCDGHTIEVRRLR
jgi:hypothetical protein